MPALAHIPGRNAQARTRAMRRTGIADRAEAHTAFVPSRRKDWTDLPEAAALLAGCAADPPATRMVKVTDLTTFHAPRYVGARVRRLNAIHRAEAGRIFAACEAARDYTAFDAHCRRTVQDALADGILHAALARSAACDARALESLEDRMSGKAPLCPVGPFAPCDPAD